MAVIGLKHPASKTDKNPATTRKTRFAVFIENLLRLREYKEIKRASRQKTRAVGCAGGCANGRGNREGGGGRGARNEWGGGVTYCPFFATGGPAFSTYQSSFAPLVLLYSRTSKKQSLRMEGAALEALDSWILQKKLFFRIIRGMFSYGRSES
jgi:hypothetical protein